MRLVLFGTMDNQSFIFASNRLREAVGASYLIWRITTETVRRETKRLGGRIVRSASGTALVVVDDEDTARLLVTEVTADALDQAHGLRVLGAHVEIAGPTPTAEDERLVRGELRAHASAVPEPAARAARLPVVARRRGSPTRRRSSRDRCRRR